MGPRAASQEFITELLSRVFYNSDNVVQSVDGDDLAECIQKSRFDQPFLIPEKDGLFLNVPPPDFSVKDVATFVGPKTIIDVIDVKGQFDFKMKIKDFVNWFYQADRGDKIYNVLSLEISDTELSEMVVPPKVVQDLSLVNKCWPKLEKGEAFVGDMDELEDKPEVLKFCLMSAANSYTDFHVDFGGSSVWYHILSGEKIFYLVPPTEKNLQSYEEWMNSDDNLTTFFGDYCGSDVYQMSVKAGNTIMLPSGWIHAVYTPVDSLVFGGNFLHLYSIDMQLTVYEMEKRLRTQKRFQFPHFEKLHWFAAETWFEEFQAIREENLIPEQSVLDGCHTLVLTLQQWFEKRKGTPYTANYIPLNSNIPPKQLLRQLEKLLHWFEREETRKRVAAEREQAKQMKGASKMSKSRKLMKLKIKKLSTGAEDSDSNHFIVGDKSDDEESDDSDSKLVIITPMPKKRKPYSDDIGIDITKCREDDDYYYPNPADETSSDEESPEKKPKRSKKKTTDDNFQSSSKSSSSSKKTSSKKISTAKQRLGRKLGIVR